MAAANITDGLKAWLTTAIGDTWTFKVLYGQDSSDEVLQKNTKESNLFGFINFNGYNIEEHYEDSKADKRVWPITVFLFNNFIESEADILTKTNLLIAAMDSNNTYTGGSTRYTIEEKNTQYLKDSNYIYIQWEIEVY